MNIGLVLAGGSSKGAYQLGALKAISERIPKENVKCVSCSSVGGLNGFAYMSDNLEKAETMWKTVCPQNERVWFSKIVTGTEVGSFIHSLCCTPCQIKSDFYISLLDLDRMSLVYQNMTQILPQNYELYLKAGIAIPLYNKAVSINGIRYYDGAFVDNIPVFPLLKHYLDFIICIYFDNCSYTFENTYFDNKVIKIVFTENNSLIFEKNEISSLIQHGYNETADILDVVLNHGLEDKDYILHIIQMLSCNHRIIRKRVTGDVVLTNINKLTGIIAKRRIQS